MNSPITVDDAKLVLGLSQLIDLCVGNAPLTTAEREEVFRIAAGCDAAESAAHASVSKQTIRFRRKRIMKKLDVAGSSRLVSHLLVQSVSMLVRREALNAARSLDAIAVNAA